MIVVAVLLAAASLGSPDTGVRTQVDAGKMLCSNPDEASKTCSAIASYARTPDGSFIETTQLVLPAAQPLTLQLSARAEIKGSLVCGVLSEADLKNGVVRIDGAALPADQNAAALNKLAERLRPMVDRQICEELRVEDGRLMKYGQAERVDIKLPGKPVRWISRADGYRVASH